MSETEKLDNIMAPFRDRNLRFPTHPQLVPDLYCFDMPDGLGIQLRGGEKTFVVRGSLAEVAIPWILRTVDGKSTVAELLTRCPVGLTAEDAARALFLAFRRGIIQAPEPGIPEPDSTLKRQMLFWGRNLGGTRINASSQEVQDKLGAGKILLLGDGLFGAMTCDLLTRSGCTDIVLLDWSNEEQLKEMFSHPDLPFKLTIETVGKSIDKAIQRLRVWTPEIDLIVTATRNAPQQLFEEINRVCLDNQCKWLRANDTASSIEIGPYIEPFSSPCFACLIARQSCASEQAIEEELYQEHLAEASVTGALAGESLAGAATAAGFVSSEVVRILTGIYQPQFDGSVLTVSNAGALSLNRFRRVPLCPDCYKGERTRLSEQTLPITV